MPRPIASSSKLLSSSDQETGAATQGETHHPARVVRLSFCVKCLLDHRTTGVDGSDTESDAEEDVERHQAIGTALPEE